MHEECSHVGRGVGATVAAGAAMGPATRVAGPAAAGQRPQLLLQNPFMKATLHLPKAFCWAHV